MDEVDDELVCLIDKLEVMDDDDDQTEPDEVTDDDIHDDAE